MSDQTNQRVQYIAEIDHIGDRVWTLVGGAVLYDEILEEILTDVSVASPEDIWPEIERYYTALHQELAIRMSATPVINPNADAMVILEERAFSPNIVYIHIETNEDDTSEPPIVKTSLVSPSVPGLVVMNQYIQETRSMETFETFIKTITVHGQ